MTNFNVGVNLKEGSSLSPVSGISTAISGIVGNFVKGELNKAVLVTSWSDFVKKYGAVPATGSTAWYSVKGFFAKVGSGSLYVVRIASSTAAKATKTLQDRQGSPQNTLTINAKSEGLWGNNLSITIADHAILTTAPAVSISASATSAQLVSIGGLEVGSDLKFYNGTNTEYRRIIQINAANNTVYWTTGLTYGYTTVNGVITSMEFTIAVYENGLLVETWSGLSMNDSVTFFCERVVVSDYISVVDLKTTDTGYQDLPAVASTPQALISGANGLSDVDAADYVGVQASKTGIYAFDEVNDLFRLCCPNPLLTDVDPVAAYKTLVQSILDYVNARKTVQYYADIPYNTSVANAVIFAAAYEGRQICFFYPWCKVVENGLDVWLPPSSLVMACAVEKDYRRGVHKNIGNERLSYVTDLRYHVSVAEGETLNAAGINTLRIPFSGAGLRVYGGRTRSAVTAWRFIHYSELWNYIGRSLDIASQDIIFEPHDEFLWKAVKRRFEAFLANEQRKGALFNAADPTGIPYRVVMDTTNNPADQVALGVATVGVEYVPVGTVEKFVIELTSSPAGFLSLS